MPHVKVLVSGACRVESDAIYFLKRASEERTAALHARHSDARQKHLHNAERYEERVRTIAVRRQELTLGGEPRTGVESSLPSS
jgi:hypothetical protein